MPTLNKIAEWWADQDTDPTYGDRLSVIGLGEPFCFRCGWLAPVDDTIPTAQSWRASSSWLDRAHLEDHCETGNDHVSNLVPLCRLCHSEQPEQLSREAALEWVKKGMPLRSHWGWQMLTDSMDDFPNRHGMKHIWIRWCEALALTRVGAA
jgi:hypothetical protein